MSSVCTKVSKVLSMAAFGREQGVRGAKSTKNHRHSLVQHGVCKRSSTQEACQTWKDRTKGKKFCSFRDIDDAVVCNIERESPAQLSG